MTKEEILKYPCTPPKGIFHFPQGVMCLHKEEDTGKESIKIKRISGDEFEFEITPKDLTKEEQKDFPIRICEYEVLKEEEMEEEPKEIVKSEKKIDITVNNKHRVKIRDGELLKIGNTIGYSAGTDAITITNEAAATCQSIYDADQTNGWGQSAKQGASQFLFTCNWIFANSDFVSTNEFIHFEKTGGYIRHNTSSSFRLGIRDGNGNVHSGSTLKMTSCNLSFWSTGGAAGSLELYDSFINLPGAYFRTYSGTTQIVKIIGSIIQAWSGGRFQGENQSCILENLYIHDATSYNFGPKGAGQLFNNILSTRNAYGIYYSSPSGGYADGTMYNIKARNNTYFGKIVVGTPGDLYLVNPDTDVWNFLWSGTGATIIYRQYEFDLKVTDVEGNAIGTALVRIWDKDNISHYGYSFSNSVLLDTESFETGYGKWTSSGDLAWTRLNYATPTTSSGPDTAYDGSWYVYTEASGDGVGYPNKVSYLTYDASIVGEGKVDFWYHKYGVNCGPLEVHAYYGGAWHTIWSKAAGNDGNTWFNAVAYFPATTTNIRFKSTTGTFAYADTALDLIRVYSGKMTALGTNTNGSGKITTAILNYGTYTKDDGNTVTMKTPHIVEITKKGYQTYKKKFTVDEKISWRIRLKRIPISTDNETIL